MEELAEQVGETSRLRDGDSATWEALYERIYPGMIAYAERRLGSGEEARDAVSEALTRAVASVVRLAETGASIEAWCFGVLRHVVLDQQRRTYRHRSGRSTREILPPEPWEGLVLSDEQRAVRAAFEQLPEHDREVLELRVVAGLGGDEVAAILGMRPGAVRMAQSRALTRLREIFAGEDAP